MKKLPPRRALEFLRWFCREDYVEEIEGDLIEIFEKECEQYPGKAKIKFTWSVVKHLRPEFIKSFKTNYRINTTAMFRHNLLITYRNFLRYKSSFFINLIGLSTGLASALLIYLWVCDEYSIDRFNEKDSQLFQIIKTSLNADGTVDTHESTPCLLAQAMANEIPEVEYAVSVVTENVGILSSGHKHIKARPQFVDEDFFRVFSYQLMGGNPDKVLSDKRGILLSDKLALKFFNTTENVVGKTLEWDGEDKLDGPYMISGIFQSPPANASAQFDVLFNYSLYYDTFKDVWGLDLWYSNNPSTYLILRKGTDVKEFNNKIRNFSKAKYKEAHGSVSEFEGEIFVQRYSDQYLYNHYVNGMQSGGRIEYVKIFSTIAIFIVIIACINFMNLATAKASRRIKEVGIKKAIGAGRKALIAQYLTESMLTTFLSLTVSVMLVLLLLPQFNQITGKELSFRPDSYVVLVLLGIALFTGLLSGSYPAFYLSGFNPVAVLKGKLHNSRGWWSEAWARKGLVVLQFTISIMLIVSVLVIYKQIDFIHSKNLGYNKDNVIAFASEGNLRQSLGTFLSQVKQIPGVVNASSMDGDMIGNHSGGGGISWPGQLPGEGIEFDGLDVDYDLLETLGLKMKDGRFFSQQFTGEGDKVIFNETAIRAMKLTDPIGQTVTMWGKDKQIIGVVDDFHFESLYNKVGPFFFRFSENNGSVLVKIKAGTEPETLDRLQKFYQAYNLGLPFEYRFLDEYYQELYASEQRVSVLSRYFAGIAILISCLGLFGLAAFTADRRTKEIGIRKILGSSEFGIVYLLSGDFTRMVIAAIAIALPISYFITKNWLNHYAYRTSLEAWYFVTAGLAALLVAWITVGMQIIKAARINPVESLRSE